MVYFKEKEKGHIVKVKQNKLFCDCMESTFEGLPCKHEFCIYIKESKHISMLNISQRWSLEYFNPETICPIEDNSDEESENFEEEDQEENEDEERIEEDNKEIFDPLSSHLNSDMEDFQVSCFFV